MEGWRGPCLAARKEPSASLIFWVMAVVARSIGWLNCLRLIISPGALFFRNVCFYYSLLLLARSLSWLHTRSWHPCIVFAAELFFESISITWIVARPRWELPCVNRYQHLNLDTDAAARSEGTICLVLLFETYLSKLELFLTYTTKTFKTARDWFCRFQQSGSSGP